MYRVQVCDCATVCAGMDDVSDTAGLPFVWMQCVVVILVLCTSGALGRPGEKPLTTRWVNQWCPSLSV